MNFLFQRCRGRFETRSQHSEDLRRLQQDGRRPAVPDNLNEQAGDSFANLNDYRSKKLDRFFVK